MAPAPVPEGVVATRSAGLRYVSDDQPGIRRVRNGRTFSYRHERGGKVDDAKTLARIRRLAIPPAWTDVWICPGEDGHIQATGRDARGRKQYRYHADWRAVRDETKYERMIAFGRALPKIRRRVASDLRRRGLGREKVLATMVRLLETTLVRVGNEEYARTNGSIGLSTMRDRHVKISCGTLHFSFKGKSGQYHHIDLHDPRIAGVVHRAQDLPGQELFQYLDDEGRRQKVSSEDVNEYLRRIAGREYSAKDFRTWAGTVLAAIALAQFKAFETKAQAKRNLVAAIEHVASRLGNTPAVCRKCYIHPVVLESYLDGATVSVLRRRVDDALSHGLPQLSGAEGAVLAFLRDQLHRRARLPLATALRRSVAAANQSPRCGHRREISGGAAATARGRPRRSRPSRPPRRPGPAAGAGRAHR
ncbi:MAG TPA: DNA topoisomerase IB [Opitutaceae bacterium]|nr:DNA topoisomerase IB [Opitutaceae bacterium]